MSINEEIRKTLFQMKDEKYKAFQSKLIPAVDPEFFIGVRTPELRKYAKTLGKCEDIGIFLKALPHLYFDENQLHAFIISNIKDFDECLESVQSFLPFVDNWATCDQMTPQVFKKNRRKLLDPVPVWLASGQTYTVRFGIKILMDHFLDEEFDLIYPDMVAEIRSDEYYIQMMAAWYFATALAKQYDSIVPYLEDKRLDPAVHGKTIQKAVESYRITPEQKEYLKSLKI